MGSKAPTPVPAGTVKPSPPPPPPPKKLVYFRVLTKYGPRVTVLNPLDNLCLPTDFLM